MVSIKFWYIKHYGARVGDDFVAKISNLNIPNVIHSIVTLERPKT